MAARVSHVHVNQAALAMFLSTNAGAVRTLGATAAVVERQVVAASPRGVSLSWPWRRPMRHGWFKASIKAKPFRHYWRVYSDDPFGHLVEFGSVKNPAYAPFRRVLRAMGGRIRHQFGDWNSAPVAP